VTLAGKHILVSAGPTHEPIDPVRVIANRSSGRQGFAIAGAAAQAGARVTLVAGPVALETPPGVTRIDVETAAQMADAVFAALPADAAILVAAVADWRVEPSPAKLKKTDGPPELKFVATRDILAELGASDLRPRLLVGFAAETGQVVERAIAKRTVKSADWIVANDVSGAVMGGTRNRVHIVTADGVEDWPEGSKEEVARRLVDRVDVETAREMADAVASALPADVAIMVAAVADWRSKDVSGEKLKKRGSAPPALQLAENPDILATVASGRKRPKLVIGFAAETEDVVANAKDKLKRKAADWIVANDVSGDVMGGEDNQVHIVTKQGVEEWPHASKVEVARRLIEKVADALA
jgi:phosphopantothenoylcysteine decarboxylase/phosphopantothenate--cysteine ligase